jgi:hypothetical protein
VGGMKRVTATIARIFTNAIRGIRFFQKTAEIAIPHPLSALTLKMSLLTYRKSGKPMRNLD